MNLDTCRHAAFLVGLAAVTVVAPSSAEAQTWGQYGFDVLPLPFSPSVAAFANSSPVNDAGTVTGFMNSGSVFGAFLYDGATVQGLGGLGTAGGYGTSINGSGQVTGFAFNGSGNQEAFVYDGAMTGLGTLGVTSIGLGINASGQVSGINTDASGVQEAFFYDGSTMAGLGTLGGASSFGIGINDSGWTTGYSANSSGNDEVFLYNGSIMFGLGTLGGSNSYGHGINESGYVAGYSNNGAGQTEAFLYDGVAMLGLGTMGGANSYGYGVSDAGQVVGVAAGGTVGSRAVLWEGGTGYFLDALVGGGWTFTSTYGMSGGGTILAIGNNASVNGGDATYVVLRQQANPASVVPEPSTWVMLATGLMGLAVVAWRRRMGLEGSGSGPSPTPSNPSRT